MQTEIRGLTSSGRLGTYK
ncbi:unnamed protein product, partial [Didymodactylos carnosus]